MKAAIQPDSHCLMIKTYPLKVLPSGYVFLDPSDDCQTTVKVLEEISYPEEFCLALDFDPFFIARLMAAGFIVMSSLYNNSSDQYILIPKHHIVRSCLFYPDLHIKKSIKSLLPKYEIKFDENFDLILDKCIKSHGDDWLTPPLVAAIRKIRNTENMPVRPVSFALYREGKLKAGEFGIIAGRVYTSYSGYYEENNAGTVQMILTAHYLENAGIDFWDLGMPLDYKLTIGAREISRGEFLRLFINMI